MLAKSVGGVDYALAEEIHQPVHLAGRQLQLIFDNFLYQIGHFLDRFSRGVDLIHAAASLHSLDQDDIQSFRLQVLAPFPADSRAPPDEAAKQKAQV